MERAISIGQLRQNPTAMIRDVVDGATYTLTDRGRPVAVIAPHQPDRWRRGAAVTALLDRLGADAGWGDDLRRLRDDATLRDPWGARE